MRIRQMFALATVGTVCLLPLGAAPAFAEDADLSARLSPVALSGVPGEGTAMVNVAGTTLTVTMAASGLLPDSPHAAHIHFGAEARHECPMASEDANGDSNLNTTEGGAAYGPIVVSLTKTGDTSPDSALAVDRFDTAPGGKISYERGSITVSQEVADAIGTGDSVVVIHGVDHDGSGKYDGSVMSELDPSLPTEATDPALCGALNAAPAGGVAAGGGGAAGSPDTGLVLGGAALLALAAGIGVLGARRVRSES